LSQYDSAAVRCTAAVSEVLDESPALDNTDSIIASGECTTLSGLALTGRDLLALGHPPGRKLGETLNKLLDNVIENPGNNKREILIALVESFNV